MPLSKSAVAMSDNAASRILVAGANGTLGGHIVRHLTSQRAIAATRKPSFSDATFAHVQIVDPAALNPACFDGVDAVINAAGVVTGSERELQDANVDFALGLALAARANGVRRFVQVSSFAIYGLTEKIDAATAERPVSLYGQSKAKADQQLLALSSPSFFVACVRIPFLFGPQQPALIGQLLKIGRRLPLVPASSSAQRSMLTYAHAARILCDASTASETGILKAADPQPFDFPMLNRLICESAGRPLRIFDPPALAVRLIAKFAPTMHRRLFLSNLLETADNFATAPTDGESIDAAIRLILKAASHVARK
jgi:UDP-glucose 4-epimerase